MFRMTCDIIIGPFKPVKPHSVKWSRSVENISDTATIKAPAISMLKKDGDHYERVQTGLQFKEGMSVQVNAGYDGRNIIRFKGFIKRINYTIPLEIECEGFSYQLRKKLDFSRSYKSTTVKKILEDLIQDTDISLSAAIPDIPIAKATFQNCTGIQVLEWLKEKCLLTVYFNHESLYVGLMQTEPKRSVKYRLGWNVIKDNELKFNADKEFAEVRIQVASRSKDGKKEKAFVGKKDGQVKKVRTLLTDPEAQKRIAEQVKNDLLNRGYEGTITAFLEPFVEPGMTAVIEDSKYPERTGKYFITGVEGDFSSSGGRQKVKIGNSL
jgi:phage protein D